MRVRTGLLAALSGALIAGCLGFQPIEALAALPVRGQNYAPYSPSTGYRAPVPARPLASVDHPPVDGSGSFDNGPRTGNRIALTFDADMTVPMLQQLRSGAVPSWYNRELRELLKSEQIPATIFMTGLWASAYPEVARELGSDPAIEIGNHTHDHAAFRTPCYGLGAAADRSAEIADAQAEIAAASGVTPTLLRFPGDCYDRGDEQLASAAGLSVISGDVRGGDAFNQSAVSVAANVLRGLQPGSIVLLHFHGGPNAPMTAPALRLVIQAARERGLEFTTVSGLLGLPLPRPRLTSPPQPTARQILALFRRPLERWSGAGTLALRPLRARSLTASPAAAELGAKLDEAWLAAPGGLAPACSWLHCLAPPAATAPPTGSGHPASASPPTRPSGSASAAHRRTSTRP